jgi:hypothetical protein
MSGKLRTESAFEPADLLYDVLIQGHEGLSEEQSAIVNAKLILILSNHIGDLDVLREALAIARSGM